MKRNDKELNLRAAFSPMPQDCYDALMNATRSVKEEEPMKRASFRVVLIAAIIIIATMGIAFAAQQLGWVDFYKEYDGVTLPSAAQKAMNATKPQTYTVGPMTFTMTQSLADGRIALGTTDIRMTDGTEVLYAADCNDLSDPVEASVDTVMKRHQLEPGTSWLEAAQQLSLPLYSCCATLEVEEAYSDGWGMEDVLWSENGALVYFSMAATNPAAAKETLPAKLYMAVRRYDPETGEELEKWVAEQELTIPVSALLSEKDYLPDGEATLTLSAEDGAPVEVTLTGVHAEQYATGIYLSTTVKLPESIGESDATNLLYSLSVCDAQGNELPQGISLSGNANVDALPTAVLETMTSIETLPESLIVTDGKAKWIVR